MCSVFVPVLLCWPLAAAALKYSPEAAALAKLGVMNSADVTRYKASRIKTEKKKKGFYWGDPGTMPETRYRGATDLAENVSWGWHHPNGVYNTIPVGAPLIDGDMNIFLGSDDAVRKFTSTGDLVWVYGPRGQLAAAPSLLLPTTRRLKSSPGFESPSRADESTEEELRPDWDSKQGGSEVLALGLRTSKKVAAGDRIEVKEGFQYLVGHKEYYRAGDVGEITKIFVDKGGQHKAMIHWPRSHHNTIVRLSALGKRFRRTGTRATMLSSMLLGTTTSGFIFAIDIDSGEELWATQACEQIAGVKGSIAGNAGIVVAATNRCVDRYCWRYRNLTNPLSPGNSIVRGQLASDGSELWMFKPTSPVWNFMPQFGKDGDTVMFNDFEGTTYCLDIITGKLKWKHEGVMGTYVQSFALGFPPSDLIFAMGVYSYEHKFCNPFPAPGILPHCNTWPGQKGWLHALNASSGRLQWQYELNEPPSSAGLGGMHADGGTRLVVATGHNCAYGAGSELLGVDPQNGNFRWRLPGPTLYADECAGERDGADIRRAMGGRATCQPGAWSVPAMDEYGDMYLGSQVGELQRWGTTDNIYGSRKVKLLSTLTTGTAFQDLAFAFAPGMMAVTTCTSLIVFQTYENSPTISSTHWDMGPSHLGAPSY